MMNKRKYERLVKDKSVEAGVIVYNVLLITTYIIIAFLMLGVLCGLGAFTYALLKIIIG